MRAVDVHGFGGGFTLGMVNAGFTLEAKFSTTKGFGVYNTLANRALLGRDWDSIVDTPDLWDSYECDVVFGNPPCSGFSTLSPKEFRGEDSAANAYMWDLANYAARVQPPIVIFESVQQTFRQGLNLMRRLHATIQDAGPHTYQLYHVLHNNASLGGVSNRKRYFFVASRIPFGVEHYDLTHVPTFNEMLRDLEPLGMTMQDQPYKSREILHTRDCELIETDGPCHCPIVVHDSSDWARTHVHDGSGVVDGHDVFRSNSLLRVEELCELAEWAPGESISTVLRRYYSEHGKLPESWYYNTKKDVLNEDGERVPLLNDKNEQIVDPRTKKPLFETITLTKAERLIETDFAMGHNQQARWHGDRLANVITGGAVHLIVHPRLPRTLTQREAARIQGFPDAWKIFPNRKAPDLGPGWGKGVPVQAGEWIGRWARESLEGNPGTVQGVALAAFNRQLHRKYGDNDGERIIDVTNEWKRRAER